MAKSKVQISSVTEDSVLVLDHVQDLKKLSSFKTPYKVLLCIDFLCMVLRAFFAK